MNEREAVELRTSYQILAEEHGQLERRLLQLARLASVAVEGPGRLHELRRAALDDLDYLALLRAN